MKTVADVLFMWPMIFTLSKYEPKVKRHVFNFGGWLFPTKTTCITKNLISIILVKLKDMLHDQINIHTAEPHS